MAFSRTFSLFILNFIPTLRVVASIAPPFIEESGLSELTGFAQVHMADGLPSQD